ncbi:MAG: transposase [Candidatus Aminicenantes bacterium]|nr:transposase [Candidatus Aminicenantes bacterium]
MAGEYRPRHPERTVLYRVLFHHFERFQAEYETRFEKEYGFLRPVIKEVVERYLDCGNPKCGFARIRCPDCGEERFVMFSCRTRGFCPSCHAKRLEEWGEWMRKTLLLDVPHRQVVFTVPKMLRIFFKFRRKLLGELCRSAVTALTVYFEALTGEELVPGIIAAVQTFGDRINFHPHLHLLVTEGGVDGAGIFHRIPCLDDARLADIFAREVLGFLISKGLLSPDWAERILSWRHTGFNVHSRVRARTKVEAERVGKYMVRPVLALERLHFLDREGQVGYRWGRQAPELETMDYLEFIARVTSHIPDKGQVMVRYYGLYANAHRGKVRKAAQNPLVLLLVEEDLLRIPSKGWAEMIRKVYEVNPLTCPKCQAEMRIIAFLTDYAVVDRIINHLKLTFIADKPPPPQVAFQELLMAAETSAEYFS